MNKSIIIALLLLCTVQYIRTDDKCKNHAFISFFQTLTNNLSATEPKVKDLATEVVKRLSNQTPHAATADDLGDCGLDYKDQQTCCASDITKMLSQLGQFKSKQIRGLKSLGNKLSAQLPQGFKKCGGSGTIPDNFDTDLQAYQDQVTKCFTQFSSAQAAIVRGAVCAVCIGADKTGDYLDNSKPKVSQASADKYEAAVTEALNCVKGAKVTLINTINTIFGKFNASKQCDKFLTKVTDFINDSGNDPCKGNDKCNNVCGGSNMKLFSDNSNCERGVSGGKDEKEVNNFRNLLFGNNRILQTTTTSTDCSISATGINSYVPNADDSTATGDLSIPSFGFAFVFSFVGLIGFLLI